MRWLAYFVLSLLLAPLTVTVLVSFTPSRYLEIPTLVWTLDWYRQFLSSVVWMEALQNSLLIAILTAALSVPTGLCTALVLVRTTHRHTRLAEAAVLLPMLLPSVAIALGMLAVLRLTPLWGTHISLAVAHSVLATPVAYLVFRGSLRQVDPNLEAAARGLGASRWQTLRHVTLPLLAPSILVATLFALILSLNEVTLALFLTTRNTETLPRIIWPNLRFAVTPLVAAASVILLLLTIPGLLGAAWFFRPRQRP